MACPLLLSCLLSSESRINKKITLRPKTFCFFKRRNIKVKLKKNILPQKDTGGDGTGGSAGGAGAGCGGSGCSVAGGGKDEKANICC